MRLPLRQPWWAIAKPALEAAGALLKREALAGGGPEAPGKPAGPR
ncbi:MAG: hypothetical protein QXW88_08040 [Thermofilum sp.]